MTGDPYQGLETFRGAVYPWHCDTMGHMTTQFYASFYDSATLHFLASLCPGSERKAAGLGWADVRQLIEYSKETLVGDLLVIRTTLIRFGVKSIEYRHALVNVETGDLHATSTQVTVLFDLVQRRAVPLTEPIRARATNLNSAQPAGTDGVG